jgi:hypothetical protein
MVKSLMPICASALERLGLLSTPPDVGMDVAWVQPVGFDPLDDTWLVDIFKSWDS